MPTSLAGKEAARAAARVRWSFMPAAGAPGAIEAQCPTCTNTYRYRSGKRKKDCPDCAAARQIRAQEALANLSGPMHRQWLASRSKGGDALATDNR